MGREIQRSLDAGERRSVSKPVAELFADGLRQRIGRHCYGLPSGDKTLRDAVHAIMTGHASQSLAVYAGNHGSTAGNLGLNVRTGLLLW
jgi:hypothetical protein